MYMPTMADVRGKKVWTGEWEWDRPLTISERLAELEEELTDVNEEIKRVASEISFWEFQRAVMTCNAPKKCKHEN